MIEKIKPSRNDYGWREHKTVSQNELTWHFDFMLHTGSKNYNVTKCDEKLLFFWLWKQNHVLNCIKILIFS